MNIHPRLASHIVLYLLACTYAQRNRLLGIYVIVIHVGCSQGFMVRNWTGQFLIINTCTCMYVLWLIYIPSTWLVERSYAAILAPCRSMRTYIVTIATVFHTKVAWRLLSPSVSRVWECASGLAVQVRPCIQQAHFNWSVPPPHQATPNAGR